MKLAVNAVIFGLNVALSEALVLAERAGVDREAAYDVLQASAVGAPYVAYKRAAFLDPEATADRVLARPRRQGPAPHHRSGRRDRRPVAAGRDQPRGSMLAQAAAIDFCGGPHRADFRAAVAASGP